MSMVIGITHLRLFTRPSDWEKTADFYREALELKVNLVDAATGVAMFAVGTVKLLIERVDDEEEARALVGRFAGVSFRVEDIERAVTTLQSGGAVIEKVPTKQAWGDTLCHARDPAGNTITLIEFGSPKPS